MVDAIIYRRLYLQDIEERVKNQMLFEKEPQFMMQSVIAIGSRSKNTSLLSKREAMA